MYLQSCKNKITLNYYLNMSIQSVKFSLANNSDDNGILLEINGKIPLKFIHNLPYLRLQIYGKFWDAVPSGIDKIVKWSYLPLNLHPHNTDYTSKRLSDEIFEFTLNLELGTKINNTFGIKHSTIKDGLNKIITKHNDPIIELNFLTYNKEEVFSIFTKSSLILSSINTGINGIYDGPIPEDIRAESKTFRIMRWLLYPIVFTIMIWYTIYNKDEVLPKLPKLLVSKEDDRSYRRVLKAYPDTLLKTWDISRMEYELSILEKENPLNNIVVEQVLNNAAKILDIPSITAEEMHQIHSVLVEESDKMSLGQRIRGFFTFINLVWLIGIIGISISIGPCIYVVLKPFAIGIFNVGKFIWNYIVVPLHNFGVWELVGYILTYLITVDGLRFNFESGYFISLTGIALTIPLYAYTYLLHSALEPTKSVMIFNILYICSFIIPISIYYNSSFLAWIIVLAIFNCLGFSVACSGLCYFIGFDSKESLERCSVSSIVLQIIFISFRLIRLENDIIILYQTPFVTFGSITLFLAFLIMSSRYYHREKSRYIIANVRMIILLITSFILGSVFGFSGLWNTACVFLVMFTMEKYVEFHLEAVWNGWVLVFSLSVAFYYIALFLHRNPNYIVKMFESF
jgi:hypothetical protein